jgi:RecA/RadA recombinase
MESNNIIPEKSSPDNAFLDLMNQEQAAVFVKRESFKTNLVALKNGDPLIDISSDNWKYFDEGGKFIPQRLGKEVLSILKLKKGREQALFYLGDGGTYKPADQIIKQLISQLLGNRYSQYAERETIGYIGSSLVEEKIKSSGIPKLTPLSEVQPEEVSWLWEPYLPFGKVSIVEGDPGLGKTFLALALAAAVSNGWPLIGKDGGMSHVVDQGKVLYLTAEDGLADTLRPRLDKMGADVSNVIALDGKIIPGKDEVTLVSLLDVDILRNALIEVKPTLIIIDPIQAYLGPGINMSRAEEVRPLLSMLGRLAEEFECAVVIIRHLTKSGKDKASYRGMGSIDFTAAARSVLLVGKDPDDETKRVVVQTKSSLAEPGKSIGFTINEGKFEWLGHSEATAAEVLAPERLECDDEDREEKKSPIMEARKYLINSLQDGPKLGKEIIDGVKYSGFSVRTLNTAKSQLKITNIWEGRECYWAFPPDAKVDES